MKLSKLTYAAIASLLALSITPVFGDLSKTDSSSQGQVSSCTVHPAFTDPEIMAATMADPVKFNEFMMAINNPATTQAMMNCSMDPKQWSIWTANFSNPAKLMNAMAQFMNPQVYMNWMTASMNPQTYQFMYSYMNPAFYTQWMTAAMNPQFYQPVYSAMDPKWQQESTAWMFNPNSYTNMFKSFYAPAVADASEIKE